MQKRLRRHSVFFWLHMYRRIAPRLSSGHDNKLDWVTTRLVREIAECAISKFGSLTDNLDIGRSKALLPSRILGGRFERDLKSLGEEMRRKVVRSVQDNDEFVLIDFKPQDYVNMMAVEGLSYEYWLTTARLRSLGKGDVQHIDGDGSFSHVEQPELDELISSFDARASEHQHFTSTVGAFVPGASKSEAAIYSRVYNVKGECLDQFFQDFGLPIESGNAEPITNFLPSLFPIDPYLGSHAFLCRPFKEARGYSLESFLLAIAAIGRRVLAPEKAIAQYMGGDTQAIARAMLNSLRRCYTVVDGDMESLRRSLLWYLREFFDLQPSQILRLESEIDLVLDDLRLTSESEAALSLWSTGPRKLIVPHGPATILDLEAVYPLLVTLFVKMAHSPSLRGSAFEEAFRKQLSQRRYVLFQRRFETSEGLRETDASVRIGNELWLIEAHSMERPLDFEIGNPRTLNVRNEQLGRKLRQVANLADRLRTHPSGSNYDVSWATRIEHCVVSPFTEWIWSLDPILWIQPGTPRILSVGEVLTLLNKKREESNDRGES